MKLRIVVIDDEVFVRRGIITGIDWSRHNMDIVGEAVDGSSGLDVIRAARPHLVITDIRMPNKDGLQLIREAREQFPDMKFLILSVLEDFQSAREALQLGVTDYIPKLSMTPEDLLKAVLNIQQTLYKQQILQPDRSSNGREADDERRAELERWLDGGTSDHYDSLLRTSGGCIVARLRFAAADDLFGMSELRASPDRWISFVTRADERRLIRCVSRTGESENRCFVVFFMNERGNHALLLALLQDALDRMNAGHVLSVGASGEFHDGGDRKTAVRRASRALEKRFYSGTGFVHVEKEGDPPVAPKAAFFDKQTVARYFSALEQEDESLSMTMFHRLFPDRLDETYPQTWVRDEIYHWVSSVSLYIKDRGGSLQTAIGGHSPFDQLNKIETYPGMKEWCLRLHTVIVTVLDAMKSMHRSEILKAMEYTKSHYMEAIRVKEVAKLVHLSENYFSMVFTKETGTTFSQFLAEVRIEKAKELLEQNTFAWTEVGERVGFENPKYFTKVFKKNTGVTPKQYAISRS